jgi:hypothetical protein
MCEIPSQNTLEQSTYTLKKIRGRKIKTDPVQA